MNQRGIPCGPINTVEQVFDDPQIRHREMKILLDNQAAGNVAGVANPIRLSMTPIEYVLAPPTLGQHTDQILSVVLEKPNDKILELRSDGIIA